MSVKICIKRASFSRKINVFRHSFGGKKPPFFLYIKEYFLNLIVSFQCELIDTKYMLFNLQYLCYKNPAFQKFAFSFEKNHPDKKEKASVRLHRNCYLLKEKIIFFYAGNAYPYPQQLTFSFLQANILFPIFFAQLKMPASIDFTGLSVLLHLNRVVSWGKKFSVKSVFSVINLGAVLIIYRPHKGGSPIRALQPVKCNKI